MNQKFTLSSVEQCYICFFQISTIITMKESKEKGTNRRYDPQNRRSLAAKKQAGFRRQSHGVSLPLLETLRDISDQSVSPRTPFESSAAQGRTCGSLSTLCVRKASFRASPLRPTAHTNDLTLTGRLPQNSWMNTKASAMPCSPLFLRGSMKRRSTQRFDCLKDMLRNLESLSAEKATTESAMPSEKSARE